MVTSDRKWTPRMRKWTILSSYGINHFKTSSFVVLHFERRISILLIFKWALHCTLKVLSPEQNMLSKNCTDILKIFLLVTYNRFHYLNHVHIETAPSFFRFCVCNFVVPTLTTLWPYTLLIKVLALKLLWQDIRDIG